MDLVSILDNIKRRDKDMLLKGVYRQFFEFMDFDGEVNIMDEEWDYLIILDAARYDVFEEVNWIEGELSKKVSKGSASIEWLNANFTEYYYNTVYVSANPFVSPEESANELGQRPFLSDDHFPHVDMVFLDQESQKNGTTYPGYVREHAVDTISQYPDSRAIIHFMQPHAPFIVDSVSHLQDQYDSVGIEALREEGYSWKEIREIYSENLELVLEEVEKLIDDLDGKIVITADHGELLGEYGIKGHPPGVYFKDLIEIPWLEVEE